MKNKLLGLIVILTTTTAFASFHKAPSPNVYVIVHGAWGGGWAFKKVDQLLTATGSTVYRPTLTGQGERVHLAKEDVNLETHLNDIINTILFEELDNIILVGHSYGGMVITGVADRIPERIQKLIYVDAFFPEDNESVNGSSERPLGQNLNEMGYIVPSWVTKDQLPPKDVPHPGKTFSDRLSLKNPKRMEIPTTYILTVEKGTDPQSDYFAVHAQRAKDKGWPVKILEADHNPQWSVPKEFAEMLKNIENK